MYIQKLSTWPLWKTNTGGSIQLFLEGKILSTKLPNICTMKDWKYVGVSKTLLPNLHQKGFEEERTGLEDSCFNHTANFTCYMHLDFEKYLGQKFLWLKRSLKKLGDL